MAEDQDDLAAEWGLALAEQGATPKGNMAADLGGGGDASGAESGDDMASQWAAMIEDGGQFVQAGNKGGAERILIQAQGVRELVVGDGIDLSAHIHDTAAVHELGDPSCPRFELRRLRHGQSHENLAIGRIRTTVQIEV